MPEATNTSTAEPAMQRYLSRALTVLCLSCLVVIPNAADIGVGPILGFDAQATVQQRLLETQLDSYLDSDNPSRWMKRMAAQPQHLGSPYARENAEFMLSLFREWGYDAEIETFHALFPTPKLRVVELVEPHPFTAKLEEPVLEEDATSSIRLEIEPCNQMITSQNREAVVAVLALLGGLEDLTNLLEREELHHAGSVPEDRIERRQEHTPVTARTYPLQPRC